MNYYLSDVRLVFNDNAWQREWAKIKRNKVEDRTLSKKGKQLA